MLSRRVSMPRVRCAGTGTVVPPQVLPRGPWPQAGRCPVCRQVYRRNPTTGAMSTHTIPQPQRGAERRAD